MSYTPNIWVDREGTTRYFETIDTDGAKIFTPDYSQLTEIGTPVNADHMNHIEEGIANNDSRITVLEEGTDHKQFLNKTQITNCITEIPQDIKLELKDGTLTIKAGSKVYVPSGKNSDGSNNFKEFILQENVVINWNLNRSGDIVSYNPTTGALAINTATYSGSVAPTSGIFYNTETNLVYDIYTNHNVSGYSLPLCKFSSSSTGITSVDQVFNGFGYIGSTVYALPNIKGLIPNGRNEDGTLNNIELISKRVVTRDITWDCEKGQKVSLRLNDAGLDSTAQADFYYQQEQEPNTKTHAYWYKPSVNKLYRRSSQNDWTEFNAVVIGEWYNTGANTNISSFNTVQPFRAVDYSDKPEVVSWNIPDYTKGINQSIDTTYTANHDGYITFCNTSGYDDTRYTLTLIYNGVTNSWQFGHSSNAMDNGCAWINYPVPKGSQYKITKDGGGSAYQMIFFPMKGAN